MAQIKPAPFFLPESGLEKGFSTASTFDVRGGRSREAVEGICKRSLQTVPLDGIVSQLVEAAYFLNFWRSHEYAFLISMPIPMKFGSSFMGLEFAAFCMETNCCISNVLRAFSDSFSVC